jgi:hypothetical protein
VTVAVAVGVLCAVAFLFWLVVADIARWANYQDPFARTLDEIRGLPEHRGSRRAPRPYDWKREAAL